MSWAKSASDAIRTQWIPHPKFQAAEAQSLAALITADPGEVLVVLGPSRIGKSSLVKRMKSSLVGDLADDGSMPIVSMVLENASTQGTLLSSSSIKSALEAVSHPMFGMNLPDDPWGLQRMMKYQRVQESTLRTAFENALKYRQVKYVFIDEAHHLSYSKGGIDAGVAILDSLKCLAARTGVVLVLVGGYQLLSMVRRQPHLIGRKLQTHFGRYRMDMEEDVLNFERILLQYSKHLRLEDSSLRMWNEYLYKGSLGCIGLLRGWLRDALNEAWISGAEVLTREHLDASRKADAELEVLLADILVGEAALLEVSADRSVAAHPPHLPGATRKARPKPFTANPRRFPVADRRDPRGR